MQNEYLLLKIDFQSGNFVLNDFWKQKMYFLTLDKIFILDNFSFVQDKKYFARAEGRGICDKWKMWKLQYLQSDYSQCAEAIFFYSVHG